jgi:hypothetical protein
MLTRVVRVPFSDGGRKDDEPAEDTPRTGHRAPGTDNQGKKRIR